MLTQMGTKKGFRKHVKLAIIAMFNELKQLDEGVIPGNPIIAGFNPGGLSKEEKHRALEAVNLIKETRNGIIKGRTCANGAKQRTYVKEEDDLSSPTASPEAI